MMKVVVSYIDTKTLTSIEESSDCFDLHMLKQSSNLKNTNNRVCEHYKRPSKILEVILHSTMRH